MKYLVTLFGDESRFADLTPDQIKQNMQNWDAFTTKAVEAGVHLGGEGRAASSTATTVKIEPSGDHIVTDGPCRSGTARRSPRG